MSLVLLNIEFYIFLFSDESNSVTFFSYHLENSEKSLLLFVSCLTQFTENKTLRTVTERNFMFQTISNATFSVDTFFFIR